MKHYDDELKEIESRLDGLGALVNIYHAITGKTCERAYCVGMATSAVSALLSERDEARADADAHLRIMNGIAQDRDTMQKDRDAWAEKFKAADRFKTAALDLVRKKADALEAEHLGPGAWSTVYALRELEKELEALS